MLQTFRFIEINLEGSFVLKMAGQERFYKRVDTYHTTETTAVVNQQIDQYKSWDPIRLKDTSPGHNCVCLSLVHPYLARGVNLA